MVYKHITVVTIKFISFFFIMVKLFHYLCCFNLVLKNKILFLIPLIVYSYEDFAANVILIVLDLLFVNFHLVCL